jgi:hypothetical protein
VPCHSPPAQTGLALDTIPQPAARCLTTASLPCLTMSDKQHLAQPSLPRHALGYHDRRSLPGLAMPKVPHVRLACRAVTDTDK